MSAFLAIDPGVHGAIALWLPEQALLLVDDMPTFAVTKGKRTRNVVDAVRLAHILCAYCKNTISLALIERAGTRPDESRDSAHANGCNWGTAYGALAAQLVPIQIVAPNVWKPAMNAPKDKNLARQRASQLLPKHAEYWALAKHDGRAEAALIALYAERLFKLQERVT